MREFWYFVTRAKHAQPTISSLHQSLNNFIENIDVATGMNFLLGIVETF